MHWSQIQAVSQYNAKWVSLNVVIFFMFHTLNSCWLFSCVHIYLSVHEFVIYPWKLFLQLFTCTCIHFSHWDSISYFSHWQCFCHFVYPFKTTWSFQRGRDSAQLWFFSRKQWRELCLRKLKNTTTLVGFLMWTQTWAYLVRSIFSTHDPILYWRKYKFGPHRSDQPK